MGRSVSRRKWIESRRGVIFGQSACKFSFLSQPIVHVARNKISSMVLVEKMIPYLARLEADIVVTRGNPQCCLVLTRISTFMNVVWNFFLCSLLWPHFLYNEHFKHIPVALFKELKIHKVLFWQLFHNKAVLCIVNIYMYIVNIYMYMQDGNKLLTKTFVLKDFLSVSFAFLCPCHQV